MSSLKIGIKILEDTTVKLQMQKLPFLFHYCRRVELRLTPSSVC